MKRLSGPGTLCLPQCKTLSILHVFHGRLYFVDAHGLLPLTTAGAGINHCIVGRHLRALGFKGSMKRSNYQDSTLSLGDWGRDLGVQGVWFTLTSGV